MARRVGSASAAKVALNVSEPLSIAMRLYYLLEI
jgi:hypothetical protein